METTIQAPVQFTANAIIEIKRLLQEDTSKPYLRVGVKGGGCSGLTYVMDFDNKEEDDVIYDINGIDILLKDAHALYLFGITIDYSNGLGNRGFNFINPNASSTCGCGTSFSI